MNWRRRLVSPKDTPTDARNLAFGIDGQREVAPTPHTA
jgi:hypothetical protein